MNLVMTDTRHETFGSIKNPSLLFSTTSGTPLKFEAILALPKDLAKYNDPECESQR